MSSLSISPDSVSAAAPHSATDRYVQDPGLCYIQETHTHVCVSETKPAEGFVSFTFQVHVFINPCQRVLTCRKAGAEADEGRENKPEVCVRLVNGEKMER